MFGVRSAMPSVTAKRRCPELVFVKPRFDVYRAVSRQIRAIFADYTDLIEPLSLDEAYLDVTEDRLGLGTARAIAEDIRRRIREETGLTASAGVSYCKFIAKLASDHRKPDGLTVITPERGPEFVASLPVARFHGVGPKTAAKMERLGIATGADLRDWSLPALQAHFGSSADWYWRIARGIDEREVKPDRPTQVGQRRAHLRRGSERSCVARRRARAGRALCVGADRARRGQRADGDAQGQVRGLHPDHSLEELCRARSPTFDEFHEAGRLLAGAASSRAEGYSAARPWPPQSRAETIPRLRPSWDSQFEPSCDIKLSHGAAAIQLRPLVQGKHLTQAKGLDRRSPWGGRCADAGPDASFGKVNNGY